jgi:large subunit ribosomal protein L22
MRVQAKARNLSISAQKLRLIAGLVRGKKATEAQEQLKFMSQKGATMVYDAISSAVANGTHNFALNSDNLIISEIRVDQGSKLKRFRPRSRGMANAVIHPKAHLTVILDEAAKKEPATKQATKKTVAKESK